MSQKPLRLLSFAKRLARGPSGRTDLRHPLRVEKFFITEVYEVELLGSFICKPNMRRTLFMLLLAACALFAEAFVLAPANAGPSIAPPLHRGSFVSSTPSASLGIAQGGKNLELSRQRQVSQRLNTSFWVIGSRTLLSRARS